eukprot:7475363-Alexandrium_andersonii.AAC.1
MSASLVGSEMCIRDRLQRCPRRVPVHDATHGEKRSGFTHAPVICDEPSLQAALPQVLILPALASSRAPRWEP